MDAPHFKFFLISFNKPITGTIRRMNLIRQNHPDHLIKPRFMLVSTRINPRSAAIFPAAQKIQRMLADLIHCALVSKPCSTTCTADNGSSCPHQMPCWSVIIVSGNFDFRVSLQEMSGHTCCACPIIHRPNRVQLFHV